MFLGKMSDAATSLIPTVEDGGYGTRPDAPYVKKEKPRTSRSRVVASVAGASAVLGALAAVASGTTPFYTAPLGADEARAITFDQVLATKGHSVASLRQNRMESVELLSKMTLGPNARQLHTSGTKAHLGASGYQKCVGKGAKPSGDYVVNDEKEWRGDLVFVENRESFPAVTAYNDSKALLMGIACEVPPPNIFGETSLCTDAETAGFCNSDCGMPAPPNCNPGARDFGSCEPTVRGLCNSIETSRMTCKSMREQVVDRVDHYDTITVGALPCRTEPDAPFAKAAYAQMKYESAYVDWVNALNDATEVCTIGHALYVHNLALFEAHYAVVVSTTTDLKKMCAEEGAFDGDIPEDDDGNTTNAFVSAHKFDMSEAIEDAEEGFYEPSKHHHMGRKLVWWNQLCEPTIDAMEALSRSLEVETPQLMCFAESCKHKKVHEDATFDALVKAHNKFAIVFAKYSEGVKEFNKLVTKKDTALAQTIASFESFHPVQVEMARAYDIDFNKFDRFDSGADKGLCGLSSCQANNLCHVSLHNRFETFVDTETCTAIPFDPHSHQCHPPPSPPPPPQSPISPPLPPPTPASPPQEPVDIDLPVTDAEVPPGAIHTAGTEAWEDAEFKAADAKQKVEKLKLKLEAAERAVAAADQNVADLEEQLQAAIEAAAQLTGSAAAAALRSVEQLRKELAEAKTAAWEAHEAIAAIQEDVTAAQEAYTDAAEAATSAKQLVGALNNLAEAEAALDEAKAARDILKAEIAEANAVIEAAAEASILVEDVKQRLEQAKANGASAEEIAALEVELAEAEQDLANKAAAAENAKTLITELTPKLAAIQIAVDQASAAVVTAQATVTKIEQGDIVAETTDTAEEAQAAYINAAAAAAAAEEVVARLEDQIQAAEAAIEAAEQAQAAVDEIKAQLEEAMNNGDAELVAKLEQQLATAENVLSEAKADAVDAEANISTLKAQLVAAEAAATEASAAAEEALAIVEQINAQNAAESIADQDVHGLDALNAAWEAASYAEAEAAATVTALEEQIADAQALIDAAEEAQYAVDVVTAKIAEQQALIDELTAAEAAVSDIEDKLAAAQNADPVDEALVAELTQELEAATAVVEEKTAAAEAAVKVIAALQEELEEAEAALSEASEAAADAVATIDALHTELAVATAAQAAAAKASADAKAAVETATQVAEATAAHAEATAAVTSITEELEAARNADPVDEALVAELETQLEAAEEAAAESAIILAQVSDAAGITTADSAEKTISDEEMDDAADEFASQAATDKTLTYVEETVIITGYDLASFTDAIQAEFTHTVANIVQQVDADVVDADVVIEETEEYEATAALGQSEDGKSSDSSESTDKTEVNTKKPVKTTFAVYTTNPVSVAAVLNAMVLDAFMESLVDAGMDDLVDVSVLETATVETNAKVDLLTDNEILSAEEQEAADEFQANRDADYAAAAANSTTVEDAVEAVEEATATSSKASVVTSTAEAATTVEEVSAVADAADAAVEEAQEELAAAEQALLDAQEALASATTPEEIAEAQAAIEAAAEAIAEAQEELELAQAVAADTATWAAATEAHAEAVAAMADLKTQIAIATAAAADSSDPEAQEAARLLLVSLNEQLIAAEEKVAETAAAVSEAKAVVIDTYVNAASASDASTEAAEAMEAWEAAATELANANAFVDEITAQLEEAQRSGDAEAIKSLESQLTKAIQAAANAKVAEQNAKELVDEITSGIKAAEREQEIAQAEAAVDQAKEALLDAKALVSDIAAKIAEAQAAGDTQLVAELQKQLQISQAAVVAAEEAVEAAEKTVLTIQTSHAADIAQSIADEYRATSDEFDEEEHAETMAQLEEVVSGAAIAVDVAKKNVADLEARIAAIVLAAADSSDPAAQKAAQAELEKLERKLQLAKETFAAAVDHLEDVKASRDAYEAKALAHKAATESAIDTANTIAGAIADKVAGEQVVRSYAPGMAPGPGTANMHYIKITDPDGTTRYVAVDQVVQEAQQTVTDLKAKLLALIAQEKAAAESGDAAAYAKFKAQVALLKEDLAAAEKALEEAVEMVNKHYLDNHFMAPGAAPTYPDKFIKVVIDGVTTYVSAQALASEAKALYEQANDKVDELKQDLLLLLAQMKKAADAGDEEAYNALKAKVAQAKSKLRVAELHVEEALAKYNKAAEQAPGAFPIAAAPSAHDSILLSDLTNAKKEVSELKTTLIELLAKMQRAADSKDKVAYDLLKQQIQELKSKLKLAEIRAKDAQDRLDGVYHHDHMEIEMLPPKAPKAPPSPRYQGPPAVVSVDARHITWFDNAKGSVTGTIQSESKGTHVEYGEIQNVKKYDVKATDGLKLGHGDIKLPAMREMGDEAVSVAIRLKFTHAPDNGACLFHMGNGDGDAFQVKVEDGVLTFQASPSVAAGGDEKMAIIAMEEDVSKFVLGREYTIVAVLGNDGYMYLFVDGDKVAEGNGMVNELNGFIRDVTMGPRRDNYVGTCYVEEEHPLSAGIIAVDVFDGELSDLDVMMVSGSFTQDEDFTTEPEIEV